MDKLKSVLTFFIICSFICFILFWLILGMKDMRKNHVADEWVKKRMGDFWDWLFFRLCNRGNLHVYFTDKQGGVIMCCEYSLECGFAEEQACKFEGSEESCPLWRDWSIKAKIARHTCDVVKMVNKAMGIERGE